MSNEIHLRIDPEKRPRSGPALRCRAWLVPCVGVLLSAACGGGSREPVVGRSAAPVPIPEEASAQDPRNSSAPSDSALTAIPGEATPEALASAEGFDPELPAEPAETNGPLFPPESDDITTSESAIALLDELLALTLPEEPPVLTEEEALRHTPSALPLELNSHVERLINYFGKTNKGTATMRVSLGRGNAYRSMIERILEEEGLPRELFYLAMAESGFRPKARSHMRATGMWQFMASRGKQYGLRQDRYVDLRYDAAAATRAAAKHLKDLHIEFDDWYLAMAAYNSGPNRVKSAIQRTGSRDYWTLVRRQALPRETRNYVPIILAMTYVGENLDIFDIGTPDPAPPLRYDTIRTESEVSFALIADASGTSVETVKALNPALLRSATPPYGYELKLPSGSRPQFEREIAAVPPDERLNWRRYEVRAGETVQAVARRFRVDPAKLAALNSLPEDPILAGGQRLTIPTTTRLAIYRYTGSGQAGGLVEPGTGRYRIASGDTLGGIARRFGVSVSNLLAWNGLTSTRIRAGRYLIVQPSGTASTVASSSAPGGTYRVRRGDTLSSIGARFGASVAQLRAWNGIRGSTIRAGQVLKVPGAAPAPQAAPQRTAPSTRAEAAPSPNHYRIRSGDTLLTIASRFGVSVGDLRTWNGIRGSRITAGKYLIVRPATRNSSAPTQSARQVPPATRSAGSAGGRYTVRRGDTLGAIAERHGTTAAKLRAWNGIRGSRIYPGQSLAIGGAAASGQPQSYRIQRGDTLAGIAKRFAVTVQDLRRWNRLSSSRIIAGQKIVVHPQGS